MGDFGVWQLAVWWAAVCVVVAAGWLAGGVQQKHLWTDREIGWVLWHWFTGGPLETGRGPSVGVWRRTANGAVRTAASLAAMAGVHSYDTGTLDPASLAAHAAAGVAAVSAVTLISAWAAMRTALYLWWVRPIHHALLSTSGWGDDVRPGRWVKVPRRWEDHRLGVRIKFPRNFDVRESTREKVVAIVMTKADWRDVSPTWRLAGRHSRVVFRPVSRLPDRVTWTDRDRTPNQTVRDMVAATKKGTIWLGMGRDGAQVTYRLDPHPHILISGATGSGKSAIARSITAQLMAQDARTEVVNIDSKHLSHPWLRGLPGATNLHDVDDIAAGLVALADEVKARVAHVDRLPRADIDPYLAGLPRKVVIVEEAPTLMDELDAWWRASHPKSEPCPAIAALRLLLNMSRITGFHVIGIAQRADAKAMGGPQARENFVLRILPSGYTKKAWNMLVPEIDYVPSIERPGWAMVCHGSTATETQMLWITDDEAAGWVEGLRSTDAATDRPRRVAGGSVAKQTVPPAIANHGAWPDERGDAVETPVGPRTVGSRFYVVGKDENARARDDGVPQSPDFPRSLLEDTHDDIEVVTLREATESGLIPITLNALRRASEQNGFPVPVITAPGPGGANRYLSEALVRWWENRPRSPARRQGYQPLVYFIVRGGRPRVGDAVKIGRTDNLTQRLDSFADHPNDVIRTVEVGSTAESQQLEREFHKRWADLRIYEDREHFRIEGDLAEYLGVRDG